MATELGKILKIIRCSNGELLNQMADRLNLSCAELSSIEKGEVVCMPAFIEKLVHTYDLSKNESDAVAALNVQGVAIDGIVALAEFIKQSAKQEYSALDDVLSQLKGKV